MHKLFCLAVNAIDEKTSKIAKVLVKYGISANLITTIGLGFAILGLNFVALGATYWALFCFFMNRIADLLDGAVARLKQIRPFGVFYDLFADYCAYGLFLWGFVLFNPDDYAPSGAFLLLMFLLSAVSLLGYALTAKLPLLSLNLNSKSCLLSLTHNLDMFLMIMLLCLLPQFFIVLSIFFGGLLALKSLLVLSSAYYSLEISKKGTA